jgi:hypothetical protein
LRQRTKCNEVVDISPINRCAANTHPILPTDSADGRKSQMIPNGLERGC